MQMLFYQSRVQHNEEWSIQSIDLVLGLVGGLYGIIWGTLLILMENYETFKLENSLIGSIYPTSPQSDVPPTDEPRAKQAMYRTVSERGKYFYGYSEYWCISFLNKFCCCCFRSSSWFDMKMKRLQRHEAASKQLADEIDIVKLLYV